MALIKCSECGKEISDKARKCPNCGIDFIKEKNKETNKKIKEEIKNKIPLAKKIIIIVVSVIIGYFVLESSIDFIGETIATMKYWEEYTYTDMNDRYYYLSLEGNGECGFHDSAYDYTFGCNYEVIKGEEYSPKELNLYLTIENIDNNDPNKNFGTLQCERTKLDNETKGFFYWLNCKKISSDYDFNVYTKGTKEN